MTTHPTPPRHHRALSVRQAVPALLVLPLFFAPLAAARAKTPKQFVQQAVRTELAADRADHTHWLYFEVDRKPGDDVKQWVAEAHNNSITRIIEKNGDSIAQPEQRSQVETFLRNSSAQTKQRKDDRHDNKQATALLKLLPNGFLWTDEGVHGPNTLLHFKPDPHFHPPTRESRVFAAMEGELEVNNDQHRIASIKGRLIHDVKFGWGILGDIKAGGTFDVERREIGHHEWQITQTHVHIHGHELFFKSISEQQDDEKSKFKQLPGNISLKQAAEEVMKQGQ